MPSNIKVLVVEDEETWRALYLSTLEKAGYKPYFAPDLDTAIMLIDRHFFHAALLDIVLVDDPKQEQGMEILERLREVGEDTGLVMVTGFPTFNRMDRAYAEYGVTRFLTKDTYDAEKLLEELAKASEQAKIYLDMHRAEELTPQYLLRQFKVRDLEAQLLRHPTARVFDMLRSLVSQYVPLLVCGEFERIDLEGKYPVFETRYWSRFIGDEIVVRIGRREQILYEVNQLKAEGREVFFQTRQDVSGLRYVVDTALPSEFRNCV